MVLIIILTLFSLTALIVLHELGHFLLAKKFGMKVEEFGIGYPPRIFGKRIGETLYSINLIPLGGFVKILGEEKKEENPRSFSAKPLWQRSLVVLGGVLVFWIIGFLLLSTIFWVGIPQSIRDTENNYPSPFVEIVSVADNSPAQRAGLERGDVVKAVILDGHQVRIDKTSQLADIINANKGREITLRIKRSNKLVDVKVVPRISPPKGQGALGIEMARVSNVRFGFPQNFIEGAKFTFSLTKQIVISLGEIVWRLFRREKMPSGVEPASVVGIFYFFYKAAELGIRYFAELVAIISIYLAVFNLLPIPALDGGKLLFLIIEGVRRKPVSEKVEGAITTFFFIVLIALVIFITFRYDIPRIIR